MKRLRAFEVLARSRDQLRTVGFSLVEVLVALLIVSGIMLALVQLLDATRITRDTILTLARHLGYATREELLPREALYWADEVFLCGTAAEITPVRKVDGLVVGRGARGPVTARIQDAFFGLFDGRTEDRWGWLDAVPVEAAQAAAGGAQPAG